MSSEITLGEIAEIVMGQSPIGETCNKQGDGMPLLNGPTEFGLKHPLPEQYTTDPRKQAKKDDLLFCVRGSTTGRMNWADQPYAIGRGIAAIRGNCGYPNSFIRAVIEYKLNSLLAQATGSTFPNVSRDSLNGLTLPFVTISNAQNIATILEPLDDRIDLLHETNATLEAIAQALFKSWFVDFDPVRAKAEGRQPEGIDAETAALFPDSFEESELGLVPKGWKVRQIGEVVQVLGGGTPSTKEPAFWHPEEHHWVTPKDLSGISAPILLKTDHKISTLGLAKVSSGLLPINTVLMSSRAPIGYLAITKIPTAINQGFIAIPPHNTFSSPFLLLWCQQNMESIKQKANGSTFMEISKSAFRPILMVQPAVDVLNSFTRITVSLFERLGENVRQVQTLTSLRDSLLPRLISGQLRLPEVPTLTECTE